MNGPNDNTAATGYRGWWQSPPRTGAHRLINPWEYRHLRAFGAARIFGGTAAAGAASSASRTTPTGGPPSSCPSGH